MYITHIAIYTKNLERSKEFYLKYFAFSCGEKYVNDKFSSYFLKHEKGCSLEIMSHENLVNRNIKELENGYVHMAISVGSKEKVIELTNIIVNDGYRLYSAPRVTGDGYFESVISDPDGNPVEITI